MPRVLDAPADVLNFREEARACFQLGEAETNREIRIVLFGMALGWLRLANHVQPSAGRDVERPFHRIEINCFARP